MSYCPQSAPLGHGIYISVFTQICPLPSQAPYSLPVGPCSLRSAAGPSTALPRTESSHPRLRSNPRETSLFFRPSCLRAFPTRDKSGARPSTCPTDCGTRLLSSRRRIRNMSALRFLSCGAYLQTRKWCGSREWHPCGGRGKVSTRSKPEAHFCAASLDPGGPQESQSQSQHTVQSGPRAKSRLSSMSQSLWTSLLAIVEGLQSLARTIAGTVVQPRESWTVHCRRRGAGLAWM